MNIKVKYKCTSCDRYFATTPETPYYTCDSCSIYWPKEDGRNCEQCHKFGRNTEMPVCDSCQIEVEDFEGAVDPDEETVVDDYGDEIVSVKKAKKRQTQAEKNEAARAYADKMRKSQILVLRGECLKRGVPIDLRREGDFVLGSKTIMCVGQPIKFYVEATVDYNLYATKPQPFRLEFRLNCDSLRGGWTGYWLDSETHSDLDVMFARAEEVMKEPFKL